MLLLILSYISLFIISYIVFQVVYTFYLSPLRSIPGPILGKLSGIYVKHFISQGEYHTFLENLHKEYGPIVHFAPNRVIINTKEAADKIYATYQFKKAPFYRAFDYGGPNIFSVAEREIHTIRKKIVGSALSPQNLRVLESTMVKVGFQPFFDKIEKACADEGYCDIYKLIHQTLFTINSQLLLSEPLDLLNDDNLPVLTWLKDAQIYGIMQYEFPLIRYFGAPYGKNSYDDFIEFCKRKIECRQKLLEADGDSSRFNDILQAFLDAKDPLTEKPFPMEDLVAELITGFIAGTDTTANTLTWVLKALYENPTCLEKVIQEVRSAFPDPNEQVTYDNVKARCPYLEAVIYEAMRMYPIGAGFLPRMTPAEGAIFEGYAIPPNVEVGVGTYAYHRNPKIWPNPEQFDPTRFLGDHAKKHKSQYLPFLMGPRSCVGREFAWIMMSHILVGLFSKFNCTFNTKLHKVTPYFFLVLKPREHKMLLSVEKRVY